MKLSIFASLVWPSRQAETPDHHPQHNNAQCCVLVDTCDQHTYSRLNDSVNMSDRTCASETPTAGFIIATRIVTAFW